MTKALLVGALAIMNVVADGGDEISRVPPTTVLGMTVYSARVGTDLACTRHKYNLGDWWVAVPIEWVVGGYVDCGDLVYACATDGTCIEAVPVWDTGCMLHYPVWDSVGYDRGGGWPMGIDMPLHMAKSLDFHTRSAEIKVWRRATGTWWDEPPPLLAWATEYCDGPLTVDPVNAFNGQYLPY